MDRPLPPWVSAEQWGRLKAIAESMAARYGVATSEDIKRWVADARENVQKSRMMCLDNLGIRVGSVTLKAEEDSCG